MPVTIVSSLRTGLPSRGQYRRRNKSITRGISRRSGSRTLRLPRCPDEIAFDESVECERRLRNFGALLPKKKIHAALARFRQVNMDNLLPSRCAGISPMGRWY